MGMEQASIISLNYQGITSQNSLMKPQGSLRKMVESNPQELLLT